MTDGMQTEPTPPTGPSEVGHTHANVSGGWLRAAVFGAMDGLVTNIALIAGIGAAGAPPATVVLTGVAGLVAGAFSMALGEYTSVSTQNEQLEAEAEKEAQELLDNPEGERQELAEMFVEMGMNEATAAAAAEEIHGDPDRAMRIHLSQELGLDLDQKPSALVAAGSSFIMFAAGAVIPLIPYFFGSASLWLGLAVGGVGLLAAGGIAARFTVKPWWISAVRQLLFGAIAVAATYLIGTLIGVGGIG